MAEDALVLVGGPAGLLHPVSKRMSSEQAPGIHIHLVRSFIVFNITVGQFTQGDLGHGPCFRRAAASETGVPEAVIGGGQPRVHGGHPTRSQKHPHFRLLTGMFSELFELPNRGAPGATHGEILTVTRDGDAADISGNLLQ